MTQDERWLQQWQTVMAFMDANKRRTSKFVDEERGMRNWWKHQQKLMNAGVAHVSQRTLRLRGEYGGAGCTGARPYGGLCSPYRARWYRVPRWVGASPSPKILTPFRGGCIRDRMHTGARP